MSELKMQVVKVRMDAFGKGQIWIDEHEIRHTFSVAFKASVREATVVTIELLADVDMESTVLAGNVEMAE